MMKVTRLDSVQSKPPCLSFAQNTRFAWNILLNIPLLQLDSQGLVVIGNKTEVILSQINTLEEHFDLHPSNAREVNLRLDVIQYAVPHEEA